MHVGPVSAIRRKHLWSSNINSLQWGLLVQSFSIINVIFIICHIYVYPPDVQLKIFLLDNQSTVMRERWEGIIKPFLYVVKLTRTKRISAQLCLYMLSLPLSNFNPWNSMQFCPSNYFWTNYFSIVALNVSESGKTWYRSRLQVPLAFVWKPVEWINKCYNALSNTWRN